MTLITPAYLEQQKQLHAVGNYGISSGKWATTIAQLAHMYGCKDILDYGSGTGQLKAALGDIVREYDPAIPGKDADPMPADMVVCTDVLEHIELDLLDNVLAHLCATYRKVLFFTIALRPAVKILADGRNAHLIIETSQWWHERLAAAGIHEAMWRPVEGYELAGMALAEGVARSPTGVQPCPKLTSERRAKFEPYFDDLRAGSRRYSDPLCAVNTFAFWQGDADDTVADVQAVVGGIEQQLDVHAALKDIKAKARHAALFYIKPDFRNADYWKQTIGEHFTVGDSKQEQGTLAIVGGTRTKIPGVKVVSASTDEARWENIVIATATYRNAMPVQPAHGRLAIIGCYGPSLTDTWERLAEEAQDPNADVVSVSGAHDWLIAHGIVPRFHVECDPREHKADNIARAHPEVEYLLSSACHPALFDKLAGARIKLWHSSGDLEARRIVDDLQSPAPIVGGGGSVGLRAIWVLYRMGYRTMSIHGMDCSLADDGAAWAGPHAQKAQHKDEKRLAVRYNGRTFVSTPVLMAYAADFFDQTTRMFERDPSVVLTLWGDGFLQARCAGPGSSVIEIIPPEQEAA